jgi:hypothetical protein
LFSIFHAIDDRSIASGSSFITTIIAITFAYHFTLLRGRNQMFDMVDEQSTSSYIFGMLLVRSEDIGAAMGADHFIKSNVGTTCTADLQFVCFVSTSSAVSVTGP